MAETDFDAALEADALVAAQEACEQARQEYREHGTVQPRAYLWQGVDPATGAPLRTPTRLRLELASGGGSQGNRMALQELRQTLQGTDAVAALLMRVVPDTEKPEHNVVVHLETPSHPRRVWMAAIRSDEGILGDFEEVPVDGALYLLPQAGREAEGKGSPRSVAEG